MLPVQLILKKDENDLAARSLLTVATNSRSRPQMSEYVYNRTLLECVGAHRMLSYKSSESCQAKEGQFDSIGRVATHLTARGAGANTQIVYTLSFQCCSPSQQYYQLLTVRKGIVVLRAIDFNVEECR